jgi:hypothetical protein
MQETKNTKKDMKGYAEKGCCFVVRRMAIRRYVQHDFIRANFLESFASALYILLFHLAFRLSAASKGNNPVCLYHFVLAWVRSV